MTPSGSEIPLELFGRPDLALLDVAEDAGPLCNGKPENNTKIAGIGKRR